MLPIVVWAWFRHATSFCVSLV